MTSVNVIKNNTANAFVTLHGVSAPSATGLRRAVRSIPNGDGPRKKNEPELPPELLLRISNAEREIAALQERRQEILDEYEMLRSLTIRDGERHREEAEREAGRLLADTRETCDKMRSDAETELAAERESTLASATAEGYAKGYDEGKEQGLKDGYDEGLSRCKATLDDMLAVTKSVAEGKDALFRRYENELFDMALAVANKVTVDTLKQKDKGVIARMIRDAAKEHRSAEHVIVRLSAVDMTEKGIVELESLELFEPKQNVEFVIDKEAESGTVIIEDDGKVTDASVVTQLKMIEGLGQGKFRD